MDEVLGHFNNTYDDNIVQLRNNYTSRPECKIAALKIIKSWKPTLKQLAKSSKNDFLFQELK